MVYGNGEWERKMKYKSDILETIHESAVEKFEIGAISEAKMREYDDMCLVKESDTFQEYETKQASFAYWPSLK